MNRNDASDRGSSTTIGQSDEKMQPGNRDQRAQQDMKAGPKGEKSAQDSAHDNGMKQDNMRGESSKSMSSENDKSRDRMSSENDRSKDRMSSENDRSKDRTSSENDRSKDRNDSMNAGSKADSKSAADTRSQTVGQAGAGAKLSSEQRTKITTVIRDQHVAPVTHVNFPISVDTRVSRDVTFHPLPAEIVTIYPDWRGYEFILVNDQIVVVDPQTFEIVAVLDA
jgi:hypothetical protein